MKPDLPNGKHYAFLDLPQLPKELEQLCLDRVNQKEYFVFDLGREANKTTHQIPYYGQIVPKQQCIFEVFDTPIEVRQWLFENKIIKNVNQEEVGVQRSYGGNVLFPHIDKTVDSNDGIIRTRKYALNYLLTESGPRTCFYGSQRIDDIKEGIIVPKCYWHILEVKHLHGVENIEFDRITLSITLEK